MVGAVSPIPGAGIITPGPGLKTNKPNQHKKGRASASVHLVAPIPPTLGYWHWSFAEALFVYSVIGTWKNCHVSNGHPSLLWLGSDPSGKWGRVKAFKTKNDARMYFTLKSGSSDFTTSRSHPSITFTSIILDFGNHWNNGPPCHRPPLGASPFLCPCPCSCPSSQETCPADHSPEHHVSKSGIVSYLHSVWYLRHLYVYISPIHQCQVYADIHICMSEYSHTIRRCQRNVRKIRSQSQQGNGPSLFGPCPCVDVSFQALQAVRSNCLRAVVNWINQFAAGRVANQ